jgi:hypothetical protein
MQTYEPVKTMILDVAIIGAGLPMGLDSPPGGVFLYHAGCSQALGVERAISSSSGVMSAEISANSGVLR